MGLFHGGDKGQGFVDLFVGRRTIENAKVNIINELMVVFIGFDELSEGVGRLVDGAGNGGARAWE